MSHRLLSRFPHFNRLAFLDLNRHGQILSHYTGLPLDHNAYLQKLNNFYQLEATDADFVFTSKDSGEQEMPDENTRRLIFNTGLKSGNGSELWAECVPNNIPERSMFFAISITEKLTAQTNAHALLGRYPSVHKLVFTDVPAYLISNLQYLCQFNPGTTPEQVLKTMDDTYRGLKDEQLLFLKLGQPCTEEEADELRLPTGFTDPTGAQILMSCSRNTREGCQPWKKQRYMLHLEGPCHRLRRMHPALFGTDNSCLAFLTANGAEGFNTVMRSKVDSIPNVRVEDFVSRMNAIYAMAKDEDIELQDKDRQPVETLREAHYCIIHTPLTCERKKVSVMLERNLNPGRQPFAVPRVITEGEYFPGVDPRKYLETFATIPDYQTLCAAVAEKAAYEEWSFAKKHDFAILENYLRYSAYRLIQDNGMVMDKARGMCIFNTGLLTSTHLDVCLIFTRDVNNPDSKWQYHGVDSINNVQGLSRVGFPSKPILPPHYWDDTGELVYKLRYDRKVDDQLPQFNDEHIIFDRLHRFPKDFLESKSYRMDPVQRRRFLELINSPDFGPKSPVWNEAVQLVRADSLLHREIRNSIENAIREAIILQRANFKTIVPCFYPKANQLCFLLPLALSTASANPAMVLTTLDGGRTFYGKTILSMDMVYKNSRLIARPEADWIKFNEIIPTTTDCDAE